MGTTKPASTPTKDFREPLSDEERQVLMERIMGNATARAKLMLLVLGRVSLHSDQLLLNLGKEC